MPFPPYAKQSKLPLAAGESKQVRQGKKWHIAREQATHFAELGTKRTYWGAQHSPSSKRTFISNQSRWSAEILPRKGQANTDTSVLTLPLNGSSINTKYLFRCYCATSVPNDLLIPRSPSLPRGFKVHKEEGEAGRYWRRGARSDLVQHQSPSKNLWWAKFCTTELEFAPLPCRGWASQDTASDPGTFCFLQFDTSTRENLQGWQTWRLSTERLPI